MTTVRSPFTGGKARIINVTDTTTFRGQEFTTTSHCYECVDTGEQFTDTAQDEAFVQELRRQWREHNCVPSPAQLTTRRKALGLSGNEMAALLGLGTNQYRLYEKGEFPSESKVRLLQVAVDDRALPVLIEGAKPSLSQRAKERLQQYLNRQLASNIHWLAKERQVETKTVFNEQIRNIVSRSSTDGGCSHTQAIRLPAQVPNTDKILLS
ncbi:MAG: type II toxin-antitoxin system MqsA family antitoxin [Janthinobacterium lividum]